MARILRALPRKPAQSERVYLELRELLIRGDMPLGARLVEQQLAERFATSRTPIREALKRLEGDGHLARDDGGGLRPRVPSVRSMRELYDVRVVLEDLVVRGAATGGDRGLLEALQQDWRALAAGPDPGAEGASFVSRDEDFHLRIAQASGNQVATGLLGDLNERIRVLRVHDFTRPDRIEATIAEHLEIVDAVLDGDPDAAASYMRSHVQRSAAVVRERIGEILTRMVDAEPH